MSQPWQYSQESHRSPLDGRPQNAYLSEQGPAFHTNVNRSKTKKWVEAKAFSYDGDDWGDYDEQDEYGASSPSAAPAPGPAQQYPSSGRNFTDVPSRAPVAARKNSFDTGDERRAFSGPQPPLVGNSDPHSRKAVPGTNAPPAPIPQSGQRGWGQSAPVDSSTIIPQQRRDYTPSAMPQPLQARSPTSPVDPSVIRYPPPRKSSSSKDAPAPILTDFVTTKAKDPSPVTAATSPATFIRPADIYKRMAEAREKERASTDSSRPSMESINARSIDERSQASRTDEKGSSQSIGRAPLQTVAERKSEYNPTFTTAPTGLDTASLGENTLAQPHTAATAASPSTRGPGSPELPVLTSATGFGEEFWSSAGALGAGSAAPIVSAAPRAAVPPVQTTSQTPQQPMDGLRAAVDQAFVRKDDNSVPPTPISGQVASRSESGNGVSRSNTDSSSGISPIMSRVPSSAAAAARARAAEAKDMGTPAIAEEHVDGTSSPPSTTVQGMHVVNQDPIVAQAHDLSKETARRSLASPSPSQSPARSPLVGATAHVPTASVGQLDIASPLSPTEQLSQTNSAKGYDVREADLAQATLSSPDEDLPALAEKEREAQINFLEKKHDPVFTPDSSSRPVSRAESPSKGRVRDLAGKFDDIADSRRNSMQSNTSRNSGTSPTKEKLDARSGFGTLDVGSASQNRPLPTRDLSFRPQLPGQWESYTTTPGLETTSEHARGLNTPLQTTTLHETMARADEPLDLEPTTPKRSATQRAAELITQDPLTALQAAGTAIGDSIKATIGGDGDSSTHPADKRGRSVGNVFSSSRPLAPDRLESSATVTTTGPPSPDKETYHEQGRRLEITPIAPLQPRSREGTPVASPSMPENGSRPSVVSRVSTGSWPETDDSEDEEKLHSDIVKRLSIAPLANDTQSQSALNEKSAAEPHTEVQAAAGTTSLGVPAIDVKRDSSVLPAEYDTYWAGGDMSDTYPFDSKRFSSTAPEVVPPAAPAEHSAPEVAVASPVKAGVIDRRFSWEKDDNSVAPTPPAKATDNPLVTPTAPSSSISHAEAPIPVVSEMSDPKRILHDENRSIARQESAVSSLQQPQTTPSSPITGDLERNISPLQQLDPQPVPSHSPTTPTKSYKPSADTPTTFAPSTVPISSQQPAQIGRIPPFREILAIKSTTDRIEAYNSTREKFVNQDSGIRDWLQQTIAKHPEHNNVLSLGSHPYALPASQAGSAKHRHGPSLSLFTGGSPSGVNTDSPVAQQAGTPIQQKPAGSSSGKMTSAQMQAKGKDFLHSAGILGGKATVGAKGLFAKGRSRFGRSGDKPE